MQQLSTAGKFQFDPPAHHSITSSAMASSPGGKLRPNALAVLRLITSSNLVDCMTGRSAGFSPENPAGVHAGLAVCVGGAWFGAHQQDGLGGTGGIGGWGERGGRRQGGEVKGGGVEQRGGDLQTRHNSLLGKAPKNPNHCHAGWGPQDLD